MSAMGFGIGNENCYVAAVRCGGIEIFDNEYSLRATPTYVAFTDRSIDVGVGAKVKLVTNFMNTVFGFKGILGKKRNDPSAGKALEYLPHTVAETPSGDIGITVNYLKNDTIFSVTQLMAMMLTKLKMITESKVSGTIRDCVLSVPVYYTDAERRAMLDASKISDLNPLCLMNESIAVALAYGFYKQDLEEQKTKNVIFIDMGSSAITVTACAFTNEKLKILGSVWDSVGGRDFDNVLVQYFVKDFEERYNLEVMSSKKALIALMLECESLKRQMSAISLEIEIRIECFMKDHDVKGRMKREVFEYLSSKILNRVSATLQRILDETGLTTNDIYSVELVGGSCRVPAVKDSIRNIFLREPNSTLNQDEAVARGCALRSALLSPSLKTRDFVIEDIPSFDINVKWENMESHEEEVTVFSCTDKVPGFKMITICMSKTCTLEVSQKDRVTSEKTKIGNFILDNFPGNIENAISRVRVKACLDVNGIFTIQRARLTVRGVQSEAIALPYKDQNMDLDEDESMDETNGKSDSSVNSYELSVTCDVPELSQRELYAFIDVEKNMVSKYLEEKERADTRNALEEYIYDVRSKINYELNDFIKNEEKDTLCGYLCDIENWLYDNEEMTAGEFSRRLAECRNLFEPVFKRHAEWERRPGFVNAFQRTLQESLDGMGMIADLDKTDAHRGEIKNLQKMYSGAEEFLNRSIESWNKIKKHEDTSLTVEGMGKTLAKFQINFRAQYLNLKNKLSTSAQESSAQESSAQESSAQEPSVQEPSLQESSGQKSSVQESSGDGNSKGKAI